MRYKEYKKVYLPWLSEVPEHWGIKNINSLFDERREKVSDKYYPPLSVTKNEILPQRENVAKSMATDNRKKVLKGDFVINSRSDRKGSSGLSNYNGSVSLISTVMKPRLGFAKYWHYLLKSNDFIEEFYRNGKGIVADLWTTNFQSMKSIILPIPPQKEQEQIARFLDWKISEIDRLIEIKKKKIKYIEKLTNRFLNKIYRNIENKEEIEIKIKNFITLQNGISESGDFFVDGYPFLNYSEVYNNDILPYTLMGKAKSNLEQQNKFSVKEGDLFITRTSENIEDAFEIALCEKTIDKAIFSGFLIRARQIKKLMTSRFLLYYLKSDLIKDRIKKELNLVTRVSISQDMIKNLLLKVPSIDSQKEVVDNLNTIFIKKENIISNLQFQIEKLTLLKQSLISDVVTGRIDVRDITIPDFKNENKVMQEEILEKEEV